MMEKLVAAKELECKNDEYKRRSITYDHQYQVFWR
jgi:hypothetical protein